MPRRAKKVHKVAVTPDPVYGSITVEKIVNRSMKDGKKSVAQSQVYKALQLLGEKLGSDPVVALEKALNNIRPEMEVRSRRVGGAAYQVPMQVHGNRKESLAIRWLVLAARTRSNTTYHTFAEKLAAELIDAVNGEGAAVKKRLDVEHVADANRAFAHFKW